MMTENDFKGINTYGLIVQWINDDNGVPAFPFIVLPQVRIYLERRNFYCDRGRFGFWAESTEPEKVCIDYADGFPRYFFSLQRAFDEMNDWVEFRKLTVMQ
jgi:hypothetical protein